MCRYYGPQSAQDLSQQLALTTRHMREENFSPQLLNHTQPLSPPRGGPRNHGAEGSCSFCALSDS